MLALEYIFYVSMTLGMGLQTLKLILGYWVDFGKKKHNFGMDLHFVEITSKNNFNGFFEFRMPNLVGHHRLFACRGL